MPTGWRALLSDPLHHAGVPANPILSARKQHLRDCRIDAEHIQATESAQIALDPLHSLPAITAVESLRHPEALLPGTPGRDSPANRLPGEDASADTYNVAPTEGGDKSSNPRAGEKVATIG